MRLKIGTLNCQNNEENRQNRDNRASLLAEHILEEKYDILGTQELTIKFTKKVNEYLGEYHFYGDYQYGRGIIGTRFPIIKSFNQGNQIITHFPVVSTKTHIMPWFPFSIKDLWKALKKKSIGRRIVTKIEIKLGEEYISILNTHLDYYLPSVQKKQLHYLLKKVKKLSHNGPILLMGDFNMEISNPLFLSFVEKLDSLGFIRVPVDNKTNDARYRAKTAIDHVFIPKNWEILSCGALEVNITDHKAVYVEVETH